jgi:hypothetical protein
MGATACSHPFVVQEFVLISKDLMKHRAATYNDLKESLTHDNHDSRNSEKELDISKLSERCQLSTQLSNSNSDERNGENGLYCMRQAYRYNLAGESSNDLNEIYKETFTIEGTKGEPITYLFDLTLGFDFASSAQLKAVLRRVDPHIHEPSFIKDPLSCLFDHTCVQSE